MVVGLILTGWRTSSRSGATECVEVGTGQSVIGVRDSKLEHSPVLVFGAEAWSAFTAAVRTGGVATDGLYLTSAEFSRAR